MFRKTGFRPGLRAVAPWLLALTAIAPALGQNTWSCACGENAPGKPPSRELKPYANAPRDLRPYTILKDAYWENYTTLIEYNGAAREAVTLKASDVDEVRIGFLGPVENHPEEKLGRMMLNGSMLAIEEANAGGGYGGKPFKLMVHNDQAIWGASSNELVKMAYDEKVWGMLGSISGDSTHIALRVTLKAEVPVVNSAATDPTIPETTIPWFLNVLQDDRVQSYTLARRIYTDLGLRRVALLRVDERYGKFGVAKFKDAARRLGHPVVNEQRYPLEEKDFRSYLYNIQQSNVEGVVVWGDAWKAALILKQMRQLGMNQRVFGSFRVFGEDLLEAGAAADGIEFVSPFDMNRADPLWTGFSARFEKRFGKRPDMFAGMAFDAMNILLHAVCEGGLNRGKIRDALTATTNHRGATAEMIFDPNCKNISDMFLGTVRGGKVSYVPYSMNGPARK